MILFFVGIVEMAIAASWTRFVTSKSTVMNGMVTYVNIFIWYYVIDQVVNYIDGWKAIIPYAAGCAIGSMLGSMEPKKLRSHYRKIVRKLGLTKKTAVTRRRASAEI